MGAASMVMSSQLPQAFFTGDYFDSLRPRSSRQKSASAFEDDVAGGSDDGGARLADGLAAGLAHDAGNLLSALSLYSELLAYPQVLGAKHRHYASDLKLLAERSGKLIDRLVALGAEVDGIRHKGSPVAVARTAAHAETRTAAHAAAVGGDVSRAGAGRLIGLPPDGVGVPADDFAGPSQRVASKQPTAWYKQEHSWEGDHLIAAAAVDESSNLVDVLRACGGVLSTLAGGALEVTMGNQAGLPIAVHQEALERILVNLVKNAALAVRGGGSIRIQVGLAKQTRGAAVRRMALTVDDSGCGMSAAKLAELEGVNGSSVRAPDRRSDRVQGNGSAGGRRGIGLQVVRELVRASGGSLRIESREGVGTRIAIEWPTLSAGASVPAQLQMVGSGLRTSATKEDTRETGSGIVDRMEMVDEDELTAEERRLLTERSNRPVMAAESVVRKAVIRRQGIQPRTGCVTKLPPLDREMDAAKMSEAAFQNGGPLGIWPEEGLRDAAPDRSFAGSLNRSLDRQRLREQQKSAAENEGAIAC